MGIIVSATEEFASPRNLVSKAGKMKVFFVFALVTVWVSGISGATIPETAVSYTLAYSGLNQHAFRMTLFT